MWWGCVVKPFERRLRALEAMAQVRPLQPVPAIIVKPGETVEEVLAREGVVPVEGQYPSLIVNELVAPDTEAAKAVVAAKAGKPDRKAAKQAANGAGSGK